MEKNFSQWYLVSPCKSKVYQTKSENITELKEEPTEDVIKILFLSGL